MRTFFRVLGVLLRTVLWTVVLAMLALLLALSVARRELPPVAARWLERQLATGPLCVRFDQAAFSLRKGVILRGVRVYFKRQLGPPWLSAEELRVDGRIRRHRPLPEWIDSITARKLVLARLPELPAAAAWPRPAAAGAADPPGAATPLPLPAGWPVHPVALRIDDALILDAAAPRIVALLRRDADRLRLDELQVELPLRPWREQLAGSAEWDFAARRLRAHAEGRLTPEALLPLFEQCAATGAVKVCRRFDGFDAPLRVVADLLHEPALARDGRLTLEYRLRIEGDAMRYRGVPLRRLQATLHGRSDGESRQLTVSPLIGERADGMIECGLVYTPADERFTFAGRSSLPLAPLATLLHLKSGTTLDRIVFTTPPLLTASGSVVEAVGAESSQLRGHISGGAATLYGVSVSRLTADFEADDHHLTLAPLAISCHAGAVTGSLALARHPLTSNVTFKAEATLRSLEIAPLCAELGHTNNIGGRLNGALTLSGALDPERLAELAGQGELTVRQGTITRVPVFAGFTDYLAKHIPGIDALVMQSDLTMPLVVSNGVLRAERILVEGNFFSLRAEGLCRLAQPERPLDFVVQARLFKQKTLAGLLARVVTFPFSKFMEFRVDGPLAEPRWTYIGLIDRLRDLTWGRDVEARDETDAPP